jgi:prepilin-type N-terminal cleavage/methylation domain-containing protein/prepilin-type processing-associated H-X9-DG protein
MESTDLLQGIFSQYPFLAILGPLVGLIMSKIKDSGTVKGFALLGVAVLVSLGVIAAYGFAEGWTGEAWRKVPLALIVIVSVSQLTAQTTLHARDTAVRLTKKPSGFTLVELLVVIVIILLLAGILYPVFATVRAKANQVKCSSQLRQIGLGILMYAGDHDETLPIGAYDTLPAPTVAQPHPTQLIRVDWRNALYNGRYVKSVDLFICPSVLVQDYRASYGANLWAMGWLQSVKLDSVPWPSNTVLATEKIGLDWVAWEPTARLNNPYFQPLDPRHSEQLNVLYCDGHVRKTAVGELIVGSAILWRF